MFKSKNIFNCYIVFQYAQNLPSFTSPEDVDRDMLYTSVHAATDIIHMKDNTLTSVKGILHKVMIDKQSFSNCQQWLII